MNTVHRNSQRIPTVLIHTFNGKWISKKKSNVWLGWNLKLNGQECLSTLKQRCGQNNVVILSFILYKDPTHTTTFLNLSNSLSYLFLFPLSLSQPHLESGTFLFFLDYLFVVNFNYCFIRIMLHDLVIIIVISGLY